MLEAVRQQMRLSQNLVSGEIYLDGMTNVFAEPEFADTEQARSALSLCLRSAASWMTCFRTILGNEIGGVHVLIGGEGTWQELAMFGHPDLLRNQPTDRHGGRRVGSHAHALWPYNLHGALWAGLLSDLVAEN